MRFYCDRMGFDAQPATDWLGGDFEQLWRLHAGAHARACLLAASGSPVGRVLLVEFAAPARELIQQVPDSQVFGPQIGCVDCSGAVRQRLAQADEHMPFLPAGLRYDRQRGAGGHGKESLKLFGGILQRRVGVGRDYDLPRSRLICGGRFGIGAVQHAALRQLQLFRALNCSRQRMSTIRCSD